MLPTLFTLLKEYCALSLAGAAGSIIFVATKILCHDKHNFVATKHLSQQAYFCHDKRPVLSQQTRVCRDKTFVATSILLSRQKTCFVTTNTCLSWQNFCRNKNDTCGNRRLSFHFQQVVICGHSFLTAPHSSCNIKMALISAYLNARIILVVTVVVMLNILRCQLTY